jgi:hypothetical protein
MLRARNVFVRFQSDAGNGAADDGISFSMRRGATFGLL